MYFFLSFVIISDHFSSFKLKVVVGENILNWAWLDMFLLKYHKSLNWFNRLGKEMFGIRAQYLDNDSWVTLLSFDGLLR